MLDQNWKSKQLNLCRVSNFNGSLKHRFLLLKESHVYPVTILRKVSVRLILVRKKALISLGGGKMKLGLCRLEAGGILLPLGWQFRDKSDTMLLWSLGWSQKAFLPLDWQAGTEKCIYHCNQVNVGVNKCNCILAGGVETEPRLWNKGPHNTMIFMKNMPGPNILWLFANH